MWSFEIPRRLSSQSTLEWETGMLADIEKKLTAMLGDGLAARSHVRVVEAGAEDPLAAGQELVKVSLPSVSSETCFDREQSHISPVNGASAAVWRILPLRFV